MTQPRSAREIATEVLRRFESYVVDGKQIEKRGDPTDEELAIAAEGQRAALEWALEKMRRMTEHSHWDRAGGFGSGCELCLLQRRLLNEVSARLAELMEAKP